MTEAVVDGLKRSMSRAITVQGLTLDLVLVQHLLHGPAGEQARHGVRVAVGVQFVDLGVEQPQPLEDGLLQLGRFEPPGADPEMLVAAPADP